MSDTANASAIPELCPTRSQALLKRGAILVDVREPAEVAQLAFVAPEVIALPLSQLQARYRELPRESLLILACAAGGRSFQAANFLHQQGYANIGNLKGGITKWVHKGFPVAGDDRAIRAMAPEACACQSDGDDKAHHGCQH